MRITNLLLFCVIIVNRQRCTRRHRRRVEWGIAIDHRKRSIRGSAEPTWVGPIIHVCWFYALPRQTHKSESQYPGHLSKKREVHFWSLASTNLRRRANTHCPFRATCTIFCIDPILYFSPTFCISNRDEVTESRPSKGPPDKQLLESPRDLRKDPLTRTS